MNTYFRFRCLPSRVPGEELFQAGGCDEPAMQPTLGHDHVGQRLPRLPDSLISTDTYFFALLGQFALGHYRVFELSDSEFVLS